jgi:hypothetical protein
MPGPSRSRRSREGHTSAPVFLGLAAGPLAIATLIVFAILYKLDSAITSAIISPRHRTSYGAVWWILFTAGLLACFRSAWYLHSQHQLQKRHRVSTLAELLALTPTQFEHAIGALFTERGYKGVRVVGKAGDRGVDVVAEDPSGIRTVIQCKRYAPGRKVGAGDVQMLLGAVAQADHKGSRGVFVTTAQFSPPAIAMASQNGIELIDGNQLAALFANVGHQPGTAIRLEPRRLAG